MPDTSGIIRTLLRIGSNEYKSALELKDWCYVPYTYVHPFIRLYSLVWQMTIEVMLSTAFGRSVDVQGGKGGEIYEAARGALLYFNGQQGVSARLLVFFVRE